MTWPFPSRPVWLLHDHHALQTRFKSRYDRDNLRTFIFHLVNKPAVPAGGSNDIWSSGSRPGVLNHNVRLAAQPAPFAGPRKARLFIYSKSFKGYRVHFEGHHAT